jgi:hypothetical protein
MRGRPAVIIQETPPRKFTRVYEDEDTIETWTYNLDKFTRGPVEVDIKYKAGAEKRIKQRIKEAKQQKKTERQMNKINKRNKK